MTRRHGRGCSSLGVSRGVPLRARLGAVPRTAGLDVVRTCLPVRKYLVNGPKRYKWGRTLASMSERTTSWCGDAPDQRPDASKALGVPRGRISFGSGGRRNLASPSSRLGVAFAGSRWSNGGAAKYTEARHGRGDRHCLPTGKPVNGPLGARSERARTLSLLGPLRRLLGRFDSRDAAAYEAAAREAFKAATPTGVPTTTPAVDAVDLLGPRDSPSLGPLSQPALRQDPTTTRRSGSLGSNRPRSLAGLTVPPADDQRSRTGRPGRSPWKLRRRTCFGPRVA